MWVGANALGLCPLKQHSSQVNWGKNYSLKAMSQVSLFSVFEYVQKIASNGHWWTTHSKESKMRWDGQVHQQWPFSPAEYNNISVGSYKISCSLHANRGTTDFSSSLARAHAHTHFTFGRSSSSSSYGPFSCTFCRLAISLWAILNQYENSECWLKGQYNRRWHTVSEMFR